MLANLIKQKNQQRNQVRGHLGVKARASIQKGTAQAERS